MAESGGIWHAPPPFGEMQSSGHPATGRSRPFIMRIQQKEKAAYRLDGSSACLRLTSCSSRPALRRRSRSSSYASGLCFFGRCLGANPRRSTQFAGATPLHRCEEYSPFTPQQSPFRRSRSGARTRPAPRPRRRARAPLPSSWSSCFVGLSRHGGIICYSKCLSSARQTGGCGTECRARRAGEPPTATGAREAEAK